MLQQIQTKTDDFLVFARSITNGFHSLDVTTLEFVLNSITERKLIEQILFLSDEAQCEMFILGNNRSFLVKLRSDFYFDIEWVIHETNILQWSTEC